jgi:hypothetical protein
MKLQYSISAKINEKEQLIPYSGVFKSLNKALEWYEKKGEKVSKHFGHTLILTTPQIDPILEDYDCEELNEEFTTYKIETKEH